MLIPRSPRFVDWNMRMGSRRLTMEDIRYFNMYSESYYIFRLQQDQKFCNTSLERCTVDEEYYNWSKVKLTFQVRTLFHKRINSSSPNFPERSTSIKATMDRQSSLLNPSNSNSGYVKIPKEKESETHYQNEIHHPSTSQQEPTTKLL